MAGVWYLLSSSTELSTPILIWGFMLYAQVPGVPFPCRVLFSTDSSRSRRRRRRRRAVTVISNKYKHFRYYCT